MLKEWKGPITWTGTNIVDVIVTCADESENIFTDGFEEQHAILLRNSGFLTALNLKPNPGIPRVKVY